jgi:quinol monooxygenase YgiN
MKGVVITVDFRLKPGALAKFRTLIDANAIASCREEPGCRRFDVMVPKGEADRVFLYEIYDDRAAFEAHVRTPHYQAFSEASMPLVIAKHVGEFELVCEGSEQ